MSNSALFIQCVVDPGTPPEIPDGAPEFLNAPMADYIPPGHQYGELMNEVNATYFTGETVVATFYGANPRHNIKVSVNSYVYLLIAA